MQTERARLTQVEERAERYALDGELSRALAACNLVPGGAEQLTQLWRNQFLVNAGDSFAVRTPTFRRSEDTSPGGSHSPNTPISSARNPGRRDRRTPAVGPDAAECDGEPLPDATAEEHGRGRHPPHAEHAEGPGRSQVQYQPPHGAERQSGSRWRAVGGITIPPLLDADYTPALRGACRPWLRTPREPRACITRRGLSP